MQRAFMSQVAIILVGPLGVPFRGQAAAFESKFDSQHDYLGIMSQEIALPKLHTSVLITEMPLQ
jgi:hypothetical protein